MYTGSRSQRARFALPNDKLGRTDFQHPILLTSKYLQHESDKFWHFIIL